MKQHLLAASRLPHAVCLEDNYDYRDTNTVNPMCRESGRNSQTHTSLSRLDTRPGGTAIYSEGRSGFTSLQSRAEGAECQGRGHKYAAAAEHSVF